MKYSGKTDIGLKRKNNQDNFMVISKEGFLSAVVCDGMGGAKGGNVASTLAVRTYSRRIKSELSTIDSQMVTWDEVEHIIKNAIDKANTEVFEAANYNIELEGMGTTLVSVLLCGNKTIAANVGDSRLYIFKDSKLTQVTNDHSFVQYLLDKGSITKEEAKNHPNRNIILRALGVNEKVEPEMFIIGNDTYDYLLLCSDGLTTHLSDEEITEILDVKTGKGSTLKKKSEALIKKANSKGGADNITAVLIEKENNP